MRSKLAILTAACGLFGSTLAAAADPVARSSPIAGSVIARKNGEEARFIEVGSFQTVDVRQDLRAGDVLRTNAAGNLAILFSDRTQVRLGRNSTLVVKSVGGDGEDTQLALEAGQLWARAERGGEGVAVATPAATAAIRGTDWSMQVAGDRTALTVLEGRVDFFNDQGSLSLKAGEAAAATIGQAPSRLVDVNPNDREQILYYYSLRTAFTFLPASNLPPAKLRAERARIRAVPEEQRSAEDRVVLVEAALALDGPQVTQAASKQARGVRLSPEQLARLTLVDAFLAGAARRDRDAARLFEQAAQGLRGQGKAVALYGAFYSRALADPDRSEQPPRVEGGGPGGALAQAFTASFLEGPGAAIRILREAETRFPADPTLPAIRAQFAVLLDDRAQAKEAAERAVRLDPADHNALEARALLRANANDIKGALADISRAVESAPGSAAAVGGLADVQSERGAVREAEAAYRLAVELDPQDPVVHANYAIFLLDNDRVTEAKREIDAALAADPTLDIVLSARGRYRLQTGEFDLALQDLLASSVANPTSAQALLAQAAGYYESGDKIGAQQALDNADRLDPQDPVIASLRTAIAIDEYDSDLAIASAQEALRRARARGGDYSALSANRDEGSILNEAYRLQGLDAWGRYYADAGFDPASATSLTDQAVAGSANPFFTDLDFGGSTLEPTLNNNSFSAFFQGLLLDPALLASRERTANLVRRPFFEGSVGGGFVAPDGGEVGWTTELEARGFISSPFPVGFFANFSGRQDQDFREGSAENEFTRTDIRFDLEDEDFSGTAYLAAKPTPTDRVVAYVDARNDKDNLRDVSVELTPPVLTGGVTLPGLPVVIPLRLSDFGYDREVTDRSLTAGLAWSHTFGYRNVVTGGLFASGFQRSSDETRVGTLTTDFFGGLGLPEVTADVNLDTTGTFDQSALIASVSHLIGFDDLTLRYGLEGGRLAQNQGVAETTLNPFVSTDPVDTSTQFDATFGAARVYADAFYEASPGLKLEAGLFATFLDPRSIEVSREGTDLNGDGIPDALAPPLTGPGQEAAGDDEVEGASVERLEPRIGISYELLPGQLLRMGFLRETGAFSSASLAPSGVVGLQSNQLPLSVSGMSDTFAVRWDAEWSSRFFTSIDYQHQEFSDLNSPVPGGITTADISEGRLDRVSGTANLHLGGGVGLFATAAFTESAGEVDGVGATGSLPYVPDLAARAGVTFVSPENIKLTVSETYVGERVDGVSGPRVDPYVTTDASLVWEPLDKRFAVELAGYNLLDEDFEVASGFAGWSRTFTGSLKVRF